MNFGQIRKPSEPKVDYDYMNDIDADELKKFGIQGPPGLRFAINGEEMIIGHNGFYEVMHDLVRVNSIFVYDNPNDDWVIDYQY